MKLRWISLLIALWCSLTATAQVEKQVEVTKAYVPSLEQAVKLAIEPDMTDTTTLRPEIDYTITPLSLETTLATRPIRPATVTYWNFNRPRPFYLKAGAGYPLQSVLDFYASTQNPGTGYVVGYLQHDGRFGTIENDFGYRNRAERMENRVGAAIGKYLGRRTLEADLYYRHRHDRRFAMYYPSNGSIPGDRIGYSDANLSFRIGDDFIDLSRLNFEVALDGTFFMDHSDPIGAIESANQLNASARVKLGRAWAYHRVGLEAGYRLLDGRKGLDAAREQLLYVGASYGVERKKTTFEVGANFVHNQQDGATFAPGYEADNQLLPFARFEFALARKALKPFVELNSELRINDYASLTELNPYVVTSLWGEKPTTDYDLKGGLKGSFGRDRFAYRLYAAAQLVRNHRYWVMPEVSGGMETNYFGGWMTCVQDNLTSFGFGGALDFRPTTALSFEVEALFRAFNEETLLPNGEAELTASFAAHYTHRKFRLGVRAEAMSERGWAYVKADRLMTMTGAFYAPFAIDLQLDFEWIYSSSMTFFVEGHNLANQPLYRFANYPEYGINVLVGVRMAF